MNKVECLIAELCPNGVERKKLGEVTHSIRTGLNPRNNFKLNTPGAANYYVTVKEITTGKILFSDKTDKIDDDALKIIQKRSNLELGDVLFSGIGTIGKVALVDIEPNNWNCSESVFILKPKKDILIPKYLVYILQSNTSTSQYMNQSVGSTLQGVRMSTLSNITIPLPPLPIQEEIVRILDTFTELEAELEAQLQAELEARKKQYEYYRNKLLTPVEHNGRWYLNGKEVEWKKLGEIGTLIRGNGLQKKDFVPEGVGCIHYGQIYTYYGTFADKTISFVTEETAKMLKKVNKNDLIIATTSENIEDVCKAVAWIGDEEIVTGGHACIFKHNENVKYLSYFFQTKSFFDQKIKFARGTKVIEISTYNLEKIQIPLPPLSEQERIVAILDKFDALVNDLTAGLPAEIEARRKQYEYYRNKLLNFEPKQ